MGLTQGQEFSGKVALVTGGASGLGEATVRLLADAGAAVVIADLDDAGAQAVAADHPGSMAIAVDVTDGRAVTACFAAAVAAFGGIDIVINNAGVESPQSPMHEVSAESWARVTSVNGDGAFIVLQHAIAALLERGGGSIVNTSSAAGLRARRQIAPYSYAKAGLIGLTRSAALEYADRGIRVNAVAPTAVMTPLVERHIAGSPDPAAARSLLEHYTPLFGLPTPEDVAHAIVFLASDRARYITGHTLPVDGGQGA